MEAAFEIFFMLLGLAFFIYCIWFVERIEDRNYQRKIQEAREFGFRESNLDETRTPRRFKK